MPIRTYSGNFLLCIRSNTLCIVLFIRNSPQVFSNFKKKSEEIVVVVENVILTGLELGI